MGKHTRSRNLDSDTVIMNIALGHFNFGPLIYGVIMFVGIAVLWFKLSTGRWLSLMIDIGVFALVFSLHGGTMAGGFAAMIAALLAGMFLPLMVRK
jgi:hypothetical protein